MFKIDTTLRLPDTDAAGILFYGNYFKLAHEAYEAFMDSIDFGLPYVLNDADVMLLIVHAEADYKNSLRLGEAYAITISVGRIGRTSYELNYEFINGGKTAAKVKTVHVAVSKETNKPVGLPDALKKGLSQHT